MMNVASRTIQIRRSTVVPRTLVFRLLATEQQDYRVQASVEQPEEQSPISDEQSIEDEGQSPQDIEVLSSPAAELVNSIYDTYDSYARYRKRAQDLKPE